MIPGRLLMCILCFFCMNLYAGIDKEFHEIASKTEEQAFIERYKNDSSPEVMAYICSLRMKKAEYSWNPWRKYRIFQREKEALEDLVRSFPDCIQVRYIRLLIQEKLPAFLGYNKNIQEDTAFLKRKMELGDSNDYLLIRIRENTVL